MLPRIFWPGLVARFSGVGYRVKAPAECTCTHVVCTNVSRRRRQRLGHLSADDDEIFVDHARSRERDRLKLVVAAKVLSEIDPAALAKIRNRLACRRIQRIEKIHHSSKQSASLAVCPVRNSSNGLRACDARVELTKQLSSHGVESDDLLRWRVGVEHSAHDKGARLH